MNSAATRAAERKGDSALALILLLLLLLTAPGGEAHEDEEHGASDARHGGYVMMHNDLHFELVLTPGGELQLYYSDARRAELPAIVVSDVAIEVDRNGEAAEFVALQISPGGDFWLGQAQPVTRPDTIIRIGFVFQGDPLLVEVPASAFLQPPPVMSAGLYLSPERVSRC
ncbi:hypothetical protein FV139_15125 [Parahaliea maris]|uniref:Uncharacterized protein n=1 Tax=Parahaliea maris TaxID=2716870 RepID=A0A5C8ZU77_9GAMM|nr:hypothetical protein [Parahaliea maris]TXS92055.1 hypothetical protein FV139_15125 [Parahaliea maris]